ncbi:hypothetical protein [Micromonospora sp. NPDC023737]|uniref:hypothetical protein n=1 Tax=unclassified Micromonospora TaxID=2617518 RepID=UPI0033F53AAB
MTRGEFVLSAMIAGLLLVVAAGREAAVEGPPAPVAASPAAFAAPDPGSSEEPGPQPEAATAPQPNPIVDVFVEVSPSTVQPGYLVGIKASCRDNSIPATVVSDAFGRVQAQPQHGLLTAAPMVRERTFPGNYRVKLECRDGQTASTMLQVVKSVKPSRGPATGFGGTAGGFRGGLLVPFGVALAVAGLVVALVTLRRPRTGRGSTRG